jgi:hypothetical protein
VWIAILLLLVVLGYANPTGLLWFGAAVLAIAFIHHAVPAICERGSSRSTISTTADRIQIAIVLVAVGVEVVLLIAMPGLLGVVGITMLLFGAVGFAIAFIHDVVRELRERRSWRSITRITRDRKPLAAIAIVAVGVVVVSLQAAMYDRSAPQGPPPVELVAMTVNATYERDSTRWHVVDRIFIGEPSAVRHTSRIAARKLKTRGERRTLERALSNGWAFERTDQTRLVYSRTRFEPIHLPRWRPTKKNTIAIPQPDLGGCCFARIKARFSP